MDDPLPTYRLSIATEPNRPSLGWMGAECCLCYERATIRIEFVGGGSSLVCEEHEAEDMRICTEAGVLFEGFRDVRSGKLRS